jgi:hypothetical protein
MNYKVDVVTKIYTRPGISPTEKDGNFVRNSVIGEPFFSTKSERGWLSINDLSNRWIQATSCKSETIVPPVMKRHKQERYSEDGGKTWDAWTEWEQV